MVLPLLFSGGPTCGNNREWLCACTERGLVGVWNLDGVVDVRSRMTGARGAGADVSGTGAGGGDEGSAGGGLVAG